MQQVICNRASSVIKFKTGNCLKGLEIIKKELGIKCHFCLTLWLRYHYFFIVMAGSFFMISYS
jgi:hypothetical protein